MLKATPDIVDKVLIECMDFSEFLSTFSEDLKIEELQKVENLTKSLRKHIFYGLVVYEPVRYIGINILWCESADFKWIRT